MLVDFFLGLGQEGGFEGGLLLVGKLLRDLQLDVANGVQAGLVVLDPSALDQVAQRQAACVVLGD